MKRIIGFLTVATMLPSAIFATETRELSLEAAKELAVSNSPLVALADAKVSKDKVFIEEQIKANYLSFSNYGYGTSGGTYEVGIVRNGYTIEVGEATLAMSEKSKEQTIETIKYSVETNYYTLQNTIEKYNAKTVARDIAKANLDVVNAKFEVGVVSALEKLVAENSLVQAEIALENSERAVELAEMNFANSLSADLDEKFSLTDSFTPEPMKPVDINEAIQAALDNRYEIFAMATQEKLYDRELSILESYYTPNTFRYKQRKFEIDTIKHSNTNTRNGIILAVRKSYSDMLNANSGIEVANNMIAQLDMAQKIAQSKFDTGLGTSLELTDANSKLDDAKIALADAQLAYHLAKMTFEMNCGVGIAR